MSTTNNPVDNREALNNITANLPKHDTPKVLELSDPYEGKTYTQLLFPTTTYQYDNLKCDLLVPIRLIGLVLGVAVDIFQAILILPPVLNNYFSDRDIKNLTGEQKKIPTMAAYETALEETEAAKEILDQACARTPDTKREDQLGFDENNNTIYLNQDYEAKKSISDDLKSQLDQAAERYDAQIDTYLNKHLNTEGVTDLDKAIVTLNEAMHRAVSYNYSNMTTEQKKDLAVSLLEAGYVKLVEVFIIDIKSKASEKRAAVTDEYIAGQAAKLASFYGGDAAIITMQMRSALGSSLIGLVSEEDFNEANEETLQALTQERRANNEKMVSEFEATIDTSREVLLSTNGEFVTLCEKLSEAKEAAIGAKAKLDKAIQLEQKRDFPIAKEELLGFDDEGKMINLSQDYAEKQQALIDLQSQFKRVEESTNKLSEAVYQSEYAYNEAKAEIEKDMETGIVRQMFLEERQLLQGLVKESAQGFLDSIDEETSLLSASDLDIRAKEDLLEMDLFEGLDLYELENRLSDSPDPFTQPPSPVFSRTSSTESIFDAELEALEETGGYSLFDLDFADEEDPTPTIFQRTSNPFLGFGQEANAPSFVPTIEEMFSV